MSQLPANWTAARVSDLFSKIVDGSHNPPAGVPDGVPMLSARNIHDGRIEFSEFRRIPAKAFEVEDARTRIRSGDVLLTIVGTIGRSAVVTDGTGSIALQRSVAVLTPRLGDARYWMYQFQAPNIQHDLAEKARGTAQKGVYLKTLGEMQLRLAPRPEQDRIVAEVEKQFTRLDDAVAALKRVQANLKRYRASVLKAACEGRLVPTEAELARKEGRDYEPASELLKRILAERRAKREADHLQKMIASGKRPKNDDWKSKYAAPAEPNTPHEPELPDGWTLASLEQVMSVFVDSAHRTPHYGPTGVPALGPRDVVNGRINLTDTRLVDEEEFAIQTERRIPHVGDIVYSRELSYGWAAAIPENARLCLSQGMCLFRPHESISREYILHVLNGPVGRVQATKVATGSAHPHINLGDIKSYCIPVPPTAEQERIVRELDDRLSVIEHVEASITRHLQNAQGLRRSVLAQAFSGKLVSQDPNDEPASVLLERIRAERTRAQEQQQKTLNATNGASPLNGQRRRRDKKHAVGAAQR